MLTRNETKQRASQLTVPFTAIYKLYNKMSFVVHRLEPKYNIQSYRLTYVCRCVCRQSTNSHTHPQTGYADTYIRIDFDKYQEYNKKYATHRYTYIHIWLDHKL